MAVELRRSALCTVVSVVCIIYVWRMAYGLWLDSFKRGAASSTDKSSLSVIQYIII